MKDHHLTKLPRSVAAALLLFSSLLPMQLNAAASDPPLNVLLITADDLNYHSY